jgi:diguanylate cyclase (GGDEF)-like protein
MNLRLDIKILKLWPKLVDHYSYGGEEFVAVLPETNQQGAIAFANKLRNAVNDLNIEHNASLNATHVTISIGIASSESSQAYTEKALLEEADSGLYNAKKLGRNQISAQ